MRARGSSQRPESLAMISRSGATCASERERNPSPAATSKTRLAPSERILLASTPSQGRVGIR